ncbi:MAG: RcpC/CpaB family pilus assembly protein [bacterium]|nr:RcpC/CpaB family pilus assembly protein [bacterium]
MNNFSMTIKKFFTNKNTVTIIGVLVGVIVLYVGYNYRIKSKINPQSVPYAVQTISPKTKITSDMIGTVQVPPAMLKGNPITDPAQIIGKYVYSDTVIPQGSLFYSRSVVDKSQLPDNIIYDYPEGYVLVNMSVSTATTYGNKVYPGNYIDIYLKVVNSIDEDNITVDTKDKIMLGKLLENVKVIDVVDANGDSVFENLENKKTPSQVIFAVPEEYHILLRKAMYLRTYEATLIPVPTNAGISKEAGEVTISNNDLKDFINKVTVWTDDMTTSDPLNGVQ